MVASVSADTIITVAGIPMKSPMKPAKDTVDNNHYDYGGRGLIV